MIIVFGGPEGYEICRYLNSHIGWVAYYREVNSERYVYVGAIGHHFLSDKELDERAIGSVRSWINATVGE